MRIANYVMIVMFVLCVAVQYNDPDPIRWMTIYGLAFVACVLFALRKLSWKFSAPVAVIALAWAVTIIPHLIGKTIPMGEVFGTMRMISEPVEEAREMGGLLIVCGWMTALTFAVKQNKA
jgi:uncharacterized membrane protein